MNERIKEIRKKEKLTLKQFGGKLGVSDAAISRIENGDRKLTEQMFLSVCREFNINEDWLRTGKGEMYDTPLDDTAMAASNILENEDVPFYDSIKRIIQIYEKLDPNAQDVINKEIEGFLEEAKKK